MKNALICFLLAVVCSLSKCVWLFTGSEAYASSIIINQSFGFFYISAETFVSVTMAYVPFLLFQIVEGTEIYRHFSVASIYYFSRCTNRTKWFFIESLKILPVVLIYSTLYIGLGFGVAAIRGTLIVEEGAWLLFLYQVAIMSMWLYITALAVNITAMFIGSYRGYVVVAGIQILMLGALLLWDDNGVFPLSIPSEKQALYAKLLQLNPVSHLIPAWHSSSNESVNVLINMYGIYFPLYRSLILFAVMSACAVALGCFLINKVEIIAEDKER